MNIKNKKTRKGFTLVEMMVAVFIFLLMMIAIVQIFAQQISAYRQAREIQSNMENAQFAMNYIAKTLRTGTVLGDGSEDFLDNVQFQNSDFAFVEIAGDASLVLYDFSQEECIKFTFGTQNDESGNAYTALWVIKNDNADNNFVTFDNIEECLNPDVYESFPRRLTTGYVTGTFLVAPTRYGNHEGSTRTDTIGRVTTSMKVWPGGVDEANPDSNTTDPIHLQTTASLRDYPEDLSF